MNLSGVTWVLYKYSNYVKGVLHPWPILWLFIYFSQKLQNIGDK